MNIDICNRCTLYASIVTLLHGNMLSTHRIQFLKYTVFLLEISCTVIDLHFNVTTRLQYVSVTYSVTTRLQYLSVTYSVTTRLQYVSVTYSVTTRLQYVSVTYNVTTRLQYVSVTYNVTTRLQYVSVTSTRQLHCFATCPHP